MLKLVTKRCKGCGICVNFCPKKVLEVTEVGKCAIIKDYVQSITVARQPGSSRRRHRGRR